MPRVILVSLLLLGACNMSAPQASNEKQVKCRIGKVTEYVSATSCETRGGIVTP